MCDHSSLHTVHASYFLIRFPIPPTFVAPSMGLVATLRLVAIVPRRKDIVLSSSITKCIVFLLERISARPIDLPVYHHLLLSIWMISLS